MASSRSGALLQPASNFVGHGFASGYSLHHRHVGVRVFSDEGAAVLFHETATPRGRLHSFQVDPRQSRSSRQLQIDRQGLLRESAQRLAIGFDRGLDPLAALFDATRQAKAQRAFLGRWSGGSVWLYW